MKNFKTIVLISFFLSSFSLLSNAQTSPYNSGGTQYEGDFSNSVDSLGGSTQSPYSSFSTSSSAAATPASSSSTLSSPSNVPATYNSEGTVSPSPFEKVGQWIQRKTNKPTGQPELDLANQRIQAGKARIKAVKARQKLEEHIADCNAETEKLKRELQRSEEQAALLENQVKFQESNSNSISSQSFGY